MRRSSSPNRSPAPVLADLFGQLLFPRLLRAGPAAARPERVAAAGVAVILIGSAAVVLPPLTGAPTLLGQIGASFSLAAEGLSTAREPAQISRLLAAILLDTPAAATAEAPLAVAGLVAVAVAVLATAGLFVCRSAAMELGKGVHLRIRRGIAFVGLKGPAAASAVVLPLIIAGVLLAVPWLVGWMLALPMLDIAGGLFYGLGLLFGVLAAMVIVAWVLSVPLIGAAVACDGADAFDAVQRAFGMLLTRPLAYLFHAALAIVQGVVLSLILWIVLDLGVALASGAAGLPADRSAAIIGASGWTSGSMPPSLAATISVVEIWNRLPIFIALAYAVSYAHTAAVAVYLNMRLLVDGQEANELWMPEAPPGITPPDPDQVPEPLVAAPARDLPAAAPGAPQPPA